MVAQKFSEGNNYVLEIWRGGQWSYVKTYSSAAWASHRIRKAPQHKYRIIKKDQYTDETIAINEIDMQFPPFEVSS